VIREFWPLYYLAGMFAAGGFLRRFRRCERNRDGTIIKSVQITHATAVALVWLWPLGVLALALFSLVEGVGICLDGFLSAFEW